MKRLENTMKDFLNALLIRIAPALGAALVRLIGLTMRIKKVNTVAYDSLVEKGQNAIIAFWHGRLLMMPYIYYGKGATILVSQHRDGELVARAVKGFGIRCVRGSTTRGGLEAMVALVREAKAGRDVVITPDGPKGPRYKAQMGVVQLAKITGLPILPVTFGASKKKLWAVGTAL